MNSVMLAAMRDEMEKIADAAALVAKNPVVIGAVIGALGAAGVQYGANVAPKGGKSLQQKIFEKHEQNIAYDERQRRKEKVKPTFHSEYARITAKPMRELADLAAKHPIRASMPAASLGASAGASIARALVGA